MKRLNGSSRVADDQSAFADSQRASLTLAESIIISYAGLVAQMADMFPQPPRYGSGSFQALARRPIGPRAWARPTDCDARVLRLPRTYLIRPGRNGA